MKIERLVISKMEEIIIRIKFMTLSCILLFCVVAVFLGNEERQLIGGREQLESNSSVDTLHTLEVLVNKSQQDQEVMLMEADKAYLIQEIKRIDQAFKKGDFQLVEELSEMVLMNYSNNPQFGFLTEKVVYLHQKALKN